MKRLTLTLMVLATVSLPAMGCAKKQKPNVMLTEATEQTTLPADAATESAATQNDSAEQEQAGGPIFFAFDSSELSDDSRRALGRLASELKRAADKSVTIEGNTDSRGTTEYNLALGERRAKAARDYLTRLGVDGSRVRIVSYGEERPAAMGETEEAFAKNRRDEFVLND